MLPGGHYSQQGNVFTIDLIASANNVKIGNTLGGATYLYGIDRAIDLHLQILAGVVIGAAAKSSAYSSPDPALTISLPAGSRVYIVNRGKIWGGGGRGGDGDRGKNDLSLSSFCGGGGGGGAGTNSVGGSHAVEADPDNTSTDGSGAVAGSTTGGTAGANAYGAGIPNPPVGGAVKGAAPQIGGDAINFDGTAAISIYIDNGSGALICAGAAGGDGGYQNAALPTGAIDPEKGKDSPGSMTSVSTNTTDPKAISISLASTLTWIAGGNYPLVAGVVQKRPV